MVGFNLTMGLFFLACSLQCPQLLFGQDQAILSHLGRQGFEALGKGLQIVAQPDRAYPPARDEDAGFAQLVAHALLPVSGLLYGKGHDGLFDSGINPVLELRLLATDLLQGGFTALLVQLLEAVKTVAAEPQYLASLGDAVQLMGQFQQANLVLDYLLFVGHLTSFLALRQFMKCQIKF